MGKRAIIYARVSTDDQRSNFSVPTQIAECIRYADVHGYVIVGSHYIDPNTGLDESRRNGSVPAYVDDYTSRELNRPGLDAALYYLETVGFDIVIVHAIDRLARDSYIRQTLEREFARRGAKVEYALGNYDETPEGDVRKDLDATFAKWENAKRVERSNRGKRGKAQQGLFVAGRAPYGYVIDKDAVGGLAVNPEQANVVCQVFALYVKQRVSIRGIVQILNHEKAVPYLGGDVWAKSSIKRMLNNTTYAGYFYYNKYKRNGKQLIERDRDEWIKIKTTPIIDAATFHEAQILLRENLETKKRMPSRFYLLAGMVFCANCNRPYSAGAQKKRSGKIVLFYRHRLSHGHCRNHLISAHILEPIVWEEIRKIMLDPNRLYEGWAQSREREAESQQRQQAYLEELHRAVSRLEERGQNLTRAYTDPDIEMTKNEYLAQRAQINAELKIATQKIQEIETTFSFLPSPDEFANLEAFASQVRANLVEDISPQEKRELLELLHVKAIIMVDGSIEIDGWFNGLDGFNSQYAHGWPARIGQNAAGARHAGHPTQDDD